MNKITEVGYIHRTHSYKGHVIARWEVEEIELAQDMDFAFLMIDNKGVPFFIEDFFEKGEGIVFKFEDIDNEYEAKKLVGLKICFDADDIIFLSNESINDLVSYKIIDEKVGLLGMIVEVLPISGNDLAKIIYKDKEVLLPLNDALILDIKPEKKEIIYRTPEGLLDM